MRSAESVVTSRNAAVAAAWPMTAQPRCAPLALSDAFRAIFGRILPAAHHFELEPPSGRRTLHRRGRRTIPVTELRDLIDIDDTLVQGVIYDEGSIVAISRLDRYISPLLRAALEERDPCCDGELNAGATVAGRHEDP
jgi:hypothetical protein